MMMMMMNNKHTTSFSEEHFHLKIVVLDEKKSRSYFEVSMS